MKIFCNVNFCEYILLLPKRPSASVLITKIVHKHFGEDAHGRDGTVTLPKSRKAVLQKYLRLFTNVKSKCA
jgi:hypothetical protein